MSAKIPLGIFWDIENCQIPRSKATSSVVKHLRDFVGGKHPECGYAKEFCCACDVFKLGSAISESLDKNGVNVVHVNSTAKNAAEDKLQELIDMYVDKYGGTGSAVLCIISSDINLAKQIRNARRKDLDVVLIRGRSCSTDLIDSVKESYLYEDIVKAADSYNRDDQQRPGVLQISNLPLNKHFEAIKSRLFQLTENCGGRPGFIQNGKTSIGFACVEDAQRCLNRIDGQDVFGCKIRVCLSREDSASNHMRNRSRDQNNLAKNADKIRNQSMSRNNLVPNTNQFGGPASDECKSTLKGLFTKKGDNFKEKVVNLVNSWNDPKVKPDLISVVQRSNKYGKGDGKHTFFITAVDAKACRALVNGAQKYLKPEDGLMWKEYVPHSVLINQTIDNKSVIEGLYSGSNQNVNQLVKKLVLEWNDNEIKPDFIGKVERDRKFSGRDGKVALFVTATNSKSSRALVVGAKKHLTAESGIKWYRNQPKRLNDRLRTASPSAHNSGSNCSANRHFRRSDSSITSVIKGLHTKSDENVTQTVRKIIHEWKDIQIKTNFVKLVERDRKFFDKDGDILLFVTATSPEASQALITAAAKYWQSRHDLIWTQYYRKRDNDLDSNVSDFDHMSSQFSSIQDLRSICSSLQSLDDIPVTDDYKSVILGLETKCDQNLAKIVRKIVMNWNDREVQANYIRSVERFPGYSEVDGKTPLIITATSPQTCLALISGAERNLIANNGVFWTHFNSGQKLIKYYPDVRPKQERPQQERPQQERPQQERPQQERPQQKQSKESNLGIESPIRPRLLVPDYPDVRPKHERPQQERPQQIQSEESNLGIESPIRSKPFVPSPLPRKLMNSSEMATNVSIDFKVENSNSKDKSLVKSMISGFEHFFRTSKSKTSGPENPVSGEKSTLIPDSNLMVKPAVPFTHFIGNRMKAGLMIVISGKFNTDAHSFTIDFFADTDIALHFDALFLRSMVVCNNRVNGLWGHEERTTNFPFGVGQEFDVIIRIESNQFVVTVKGQRLCDFRHRIDVESVKGLSITGDLIIHWVRFASN